MGNSVQNIFRNLFGKHTEQKLSKPILKHRGWIMPGKKEGSFIEVDQYGNKTNQYYFLPRAGAQCKDGTISQAAGKGAGSHHGGVRKWIYPKIQIKNEGISKANQMQTQSCILLNRNINPPKLQTFRKEKQQKKFSNQHRQSNKINPFDKKIDEKIKRKQNTFPKELNSQRNQNNMPERNIKETKSALPKEKNSEKKDENPQKTRTKKARLQKQTPRKSLRRLPDHNKVKSSRENQQKMSKKLTPSSKKSKKQQNKTEMASPKRIKQDRRSI